MTSGWPFPVNLHDDRTGYVDLTQFDNIPAEMFTKPGHYGDSRRKRLRPETLSVDWTKRIRDTEWVIKRVAISGPYLHKTANYGLTVYPDKIEGWMQELIDLTDPRLVP